MTSFQKVWAILFPYLLYYLTYSATYIMLAFIQEVLVGSQNESCLRFMTQHAGTVSGVMSGLGMMFGIFALIPMLKRELFWRAGMCGNAGGADRVGLIKEMLFTGILAFTSSLGLNI